MEMCKVLHPAVKNCGDWCCVSRGGYVFFTVFFFAIGTFLLFSAYYVHRLHENNVRAGAVTETGEPVQHVEPPSEEEMAAARRKKRNVKVDPALLQDLKR